MIHIPERRHLYIETDSKYPLFLCEPLTILGIYVCPVNMGTLCRFPVEEHRYASVQNVIVLYFISPIRHPLARHPQWIRMCLKNGKKIKSNKKWGMANKILCCMVKGYIFINCILCIYSKAPPCLIKFISVQVIRTEIRAGRRFQL